MKATLEELSVFLAVVDAGSLTAAAEHLGQPVSTTSRLLARLEEKLETTLLRRTTRRLDLTDEGSRFARDARHIMEAVQLAEDGLMERRGRLSGPLRVDAATPFMLHVLAPLMPGFQALHPEVKLVLSSNDGFIDLLEHRVDMAVRIGELEDSTLHSRLLGCTRIRLLASPHYLRRAGVPSETRDLLQHDLLGFTQPDSLNVWPVRHTDGKLLRIEATMLAGSGETLRQLALNGQGIACLSDFMTARDVAEGRLVEVLPGVTEPTSRPVHAVYYQQSAISARISSMVRYLVEALQAPEREWASATALPSGRIMPPTVRPLPE
ncbi:LysR family transcriptional regulator [Hydrogenophaga laconesensis]|uniref:DNA-binding transcriptional LysR family regulator n=1 Tax=Hydrogenophaga laconesensis TaxID=1805971 RepID=A0ABU1VCB8_9BURK|nr:LysR family transcriptional regulator [Hydrogenophaga laconesensis]MDR7094858.1 DNA-binding transcriptional LysR family regulator [Hydrogenophaga laconesensis]